MRQARGYCTVENCEREALAKGLCNMHYRRLRRSGDPVALQRTVLVGMTPIERLHAKLEKKGKCLLFTGTTNNYGYGLLSVESKLVLAHRFMWESVHGKLPEKACVLHTCDTPRCCNIDHLFIGDRAENNTDMQRKGRGRAFGHARAFNAKEIREIRESKLSSYKLGLAFDVSHGTILAIKNRTIYRDIPD